MHNESYKTVLKENTAELIEKKSRFISSVMPVKTEQEALWFINKKKKEHYDATHNTYAYVIRENNIARFSDDGEPGGTAGLPMMEVLKKEGLFDVVVVVTRYFGGTLLGAGGLVRAYSKSAKMGVDAAEIVTMITVKTYSVECSYDMFGKVKYLVENSEYILDSIEYGETVTINVSVKAEQTDRFLKDIVDITNGVSVVKETGEDFIASREL
ncbi:MAG: YigZ family protein [Ruminococcaceae bacterium]|nr:YigZ family protein [Oscillospiraceae bacterium]